MRVFTTIGNRVVSVKDVDSSYQLQNNEYTTNVKGQILFKIYNSNDGSFTSDLKTEQLFLKLDKDIQNIENTKTEVSPIEFKLLWTPTERLALRTLRASDPAIDDFFDIIEDARLKFVNLQLKSTKDGIKYAVNKLGEAGVISPSNVEKRAKEILNGNFQ